jgi:hypothetical protein
MAQWHGGKGSSQRKVDKEKFSDNWDKIFGKKNQEKIKENLPDDKDLKFTTAEEYLKDSDEV